MPSNAKLKPGNLKDPEVAELFSLKDPEQRYEDLREIGHGAFGAVFYALDKDTHETVAIKKMNFSGKQSMDKWNDIIREVRFLKSIRHPNIVCYKASFLKEQSCWLVMEYCVGSTADILKVYKKPFLEVEIAAICLQTLYGVAHLHGLKRIHRDIKAGNILLTESGVVKLADLGSASLSSPAQTFVGSPYWMAPEVILAQDSGIYDERADIWSFGITCIELAEMRPPLLDMNAYSAMYHIAQNDPPTLQFNSTEEADAAVWSESFRSFVDQCLRKDPAQRLSTSACLKHPFVVGERPQNVIFDLINRMKEAVKEQDQSQYGKLRKLVCLEESNDNERLSETRSVEANVEDAINGDECHKQSRQRLSDQQVKDEINTLRRSKFSTLRTTKIIAKEVQDYQAENNLYEQMCGYKRLRQQHHKELRQLEDRCTFEAEACRLKLDREYEQVYQNCQREMSKVKSQVQIELERKLRENDDELRKSRKSKQSHLKNDLKSYVACQKKEYKFNKERCKTDLKEKGLSRVNYESALKTVKTKLSEIKERTEHKYMAEQNLMLEKDLKELQRQQLMRHHSLENQLTNNELNIRARQIETQHALLIKHHEVARDQELSHFHAIEQLKQRHLEVQHELELNSQTDFNKRALEQKTKEHALQSKQQPRELKGKEAIIRKQFRQAVKIQTRQFKAYQAQMLQMAPREEHKELLNRLKEEQNRKIASLADQYESTIETMVTEQTIKLDSQQEEDLRQLTEKLDRELSMLTEYQDKQKTDLNAQVERERVQLQDRINLRLAVLKQKMNEEKVQFERTRERQLSQLHARQSHALEPTISEHQQRRTSVEREGPVEQSSSSQFSTPRQSVSSSSAQTVEQSNHSDNTNLDRNGSLKLHNAKRNSSTNL
uniref:non-specific serine/threonine protein kinase n=1 Tax=Globodera rostochiensis TaxID=31243 RepID=A0A914H0F4_GLORO